MSSNGSSENVGPGLIDALEIMVENLRKECYAMFTGIEDFNKLKKKVKSMKKDI
jgi:hypothetical protein